MNETRNIIASLEFGEKESQICYYDRKEKNPVSLAVKTGTTEYTFPTRLSKRPKTNIWHFGAESEYFSRYEGETLVEDVLNLCMKGEPVEIDGEFHEVEELLEVFLKGCLSMLGVGEPQRQIKILMITTPNLNRVFIRKLQKVCRHLNFANGQVLIQDYNESFYYYAMRTRHDNANRSTGLFCFDKNRVHFRKLWIDTATKPMIARVEVGKSELLSENPKKRDKRFTEMIEKCCGEESYSNLYLIGEGFDKEWAVNSLTALCKNQRRVYYGNNLYVRGACFAALEKSEDKTLGNYLYVGEALVKNHITMNMNIQGKDQIYTVTEGGKNWYETEHTFELILDEKEDLEFTLQPMDGGKPFVHTMKLKGLPKRPKKATRLRIQVIYESADCCVVFVEDLGFGELFPSSGLKWTEKIRWQEAEHE